MSSPFVSLCLLVALCLSISLCTESLKADDGYEVFPDYNASRYRMPSMQLDWAAALDLCQSDGEDSTLAVINSEREAAVVRNLISRLLATGFYEAWVGINDIDVEGTWVTVQGELVSASGYDNWTSGQPSGGSLWNCGLSYYDSLYMDWACSESLPFICEKPNV